MSNTSAFLNALRGDFGPSYKYAGWDVDEIIAKVSRVAQGLPCLLVAVIVDTNRHMGLDIIGHRKVCLWALLWLVFACLHLYCVLSDHGLLYAA